VSGDASFPLSNIIQYLEGETLRRYGVVTQFMVNQGYSQVTLTF
jgi:hypothetical protein